MVKKQSTAESRSNTCTCQAETVVLLPCSGASNCGQIANQAAIKLTEEGMGNMYCMAGIGAHNEGMVESANRLIAIDGCSTACAKKLIEHLGLTVTDYVCVTDLGIKKTHAFKIVPKDVAMVMDYVKKSLVM